MKRTYSLGDKALVSKVVIDSSHLMKLFLAVGVFACMIPCMQVHAADVNIIEVVDSGSGLAPVSIPDAPITATSDNISGVEVESTFGNDIEINATEDISIDVSGAAGYGIYGHTDGDINITISGGTISATGANSRGIYANKGTGAGNVTINSSVDVFAGSTAAAARGILGIAVAGNVSITAAGNINANGAENYNAIEAQATSAGGNVFVHYTSGIITSTAAGIYANAGGGGKSEVITDAGTIINSGSSGGIVAYNAGTSVSDSIVINNAADISSGGYSAIRSTAEFNATTYIASSGNLASVANSRSAIHAKSATGNIYIGYNSDGTEKAITGTITTSGSGAHGIFADSGTSGNVNISNAADITVTGSGSHGIYAQATSGIVNINNTAHIEVSNSNSYGIYVSGVTVFSVLQNTGEVYGADDNATAIRVDAGSFTTILGTGSDLRGDFVSGGSGNALVFQGTATENSNFSATAVGNQYSLTVNTNADWTLNGSSSQLDGVNRVITQNASVLRMRSSTAGTYTFNKALSGSGTLDIALANGSDEIILDNSINSGFIGTYALGKGTFILSDSQDNSGALAGTTLRLEDQNTTIIDGIIDRHNVNLELQSGSTLAYKADGLLTINDLSLGIIGGNKIMIDFSDYFSGNLESSYTLISISGLLDAEPTFLADAENAFEAIGGLADYAFVWNNAKDQLLYMYSPIPEASSYAMIFAGVMFVTVASRRRYRRSK